MRNASRLSTIALLTSALLVATACATDNGNNANGNDDSGDDLPGLPAMALTDLDASCDMFLEEKAEDFFGYVDRPNPPVQSPYGSGISPHSISCEGSIHWAEYEFSPGRTSTPKGNLWLTVYPTESIAEAEETYAGRLEFVADRDKENHGEDFFVEENPEGPWDQAYHYAYENRGDRYYFFFQTDDFVVELSFNHGQDPSEESSDLSQGAGPGEWSVFDFDRDSASAFLIEDYMPAVHENFLSLLERTE
ncbi:hypothetical protein [Natronoglycomyces albus]|uniref:Lipoprotein n=1 Tax=Natronoglycomyces albus TaxID=2811108 RepID=A0A895XRR4_9ACTN|nr:hypothetical protein [Natronoglycomyces albus]QSB05875.1 hypothetical protein JQS30_02815 [Natronoglycomyces albus]